MKPAKFTPAEAAQIEQGLKGTLAYPPHRAHPLVNQLMERHFGHTQRDARSFEYKAGARALLLSRLGGFLTTNPHTPGTAQADAWWAGVEEGKAIYKFHQTQGVPA